jgi:hypothetical protein
MLDPSFDGFARCKLDGTQNSHFGVWADSFHFLLPVSKINEAIIGSEVAGVYWRVALSFVSENTGYLLRPQFGILAVEPLAKERLLKVDLKSFERAGGKGENGSKMGCQLQQRILRITCRRRSHSAQTCSKAACGSIQMAKNPIPALRGELSSGRPPGGVCAAASFNCLEKVP